MAAPRVRRIPCKRCNCDKGSRRGCKYCVLCSEIVKEELKVKRRVDARQPCEKCGDPKRAGHGERYCQDCWELENWRRRKRHLYREPRICIKCEKNHAEKNCQKCESCRKYVRLCQRCPTPARGPHKRLCEDCFQAALRKKAVDKKLWEKKNPKPKYPYRKRKLTKLQRAQYNELRRLDYRLRHHIKPMSKEAYYRRYKQRPSRLPALPLASLIGDHVLSGNSLNELAKNAGVEEKRVREVYTGVIDTVRIDIADKIVIALGMTLGNIYAEPTAADENRRSTEIAC